VAEEATEMILETPTLLCLEESDVFPQSKVIHCDDFSVRVA